jgi:16S rRNA (uracil1498-N3)-methyltransferase
MKPNRKRISRLFLCEDLNDDLVNLNDRQAHYLQHVLRLRTGDSVVLFNGLGDERHALVDMLARKHGRLKITRVIEPLPESPLELTLMQAVAKADAMDLIVQKSTELGVRTIYPVLTDFSVIKLDDSRVSRRTEHWRKISQGACEQSGRHCPPTIHPPQKLLDGLASIDSEATRVTLHPGTTNTLHNISQDAGGISQLCLLTGPEGGLSETELKQADESGFQKISLGPRVLRTETATLAACSLAQALWGDLAT